MNINVRDIVTLDNNNQYVVVGKVNYKSKNYYYLVNKNYENLMFCYEDNDDLVELNDKKLASKILPLFLENSKEIIEEFQNIN